MGINKITKDVESGIKRIKYFVAPITAIRVNRDRPCRYTGTCGDYTSSQRMCKITTILERKPSHSNITVLIVGEELGV